MQRESGSLPGHGLGEGECAAVVVVCPFTLDHNDLDDVQLCMYVRWCTGGALALIGDSASGAQMC